MIPTQYNPLGLQTKFYPADYIQNGLVCHYDAFFNLGPSSDIIHDDGTDIWYDCSPNGNNTWEDDRTTAPVWNSKGRLFLQGSSTIANTFLLNPAFNAIFKATTASASNFGAVEFCLSLHSESNAFELTSWTALNGDAALSFVIGNYRGSRNMALVFQTGPTWYDTFFSTDLGPLTDVHTYTYTCESKSLWKMYVDGTYVGSITSTRNYSCSNINDKTTAFSVGATHRFSELYPSTQALSRSGYTIHSIRAYNQQLTESDIAHNAALDQLWYGNQ